MSPWRDICFAVLLTGYNRSLIYRLAPLLLALVIIWKCLPFSTHFVAVPYCFVKQTIWQLLLTYLHIRWHLSIALTNVYMMCHINFALHLLHQPNWYFKQQYESALGCIPETCEYPPCAVCVQEAVDGCRKLWLQNEQVGCHSWGKKRRGDQKMCVL